MSWHANSLERKYFIFNDKNSQEKYRKTMIIIFSILVIIYLYFLKGSYDDLKNINVFDSEEKKKLLFMSFIGSLLVAISSLIFLYIIIEDEEINVEIAFN